MMIIMMMMKSGGTRTNTAGGASRVVRLNPPSFRDLSHHRQPKLISETCKKGGHYEPLYWEFTHLSKILEYCYYCGNKVYLPSVDRVLVC